MNDSDMESKLADELHSCLVSILMNQTFTIDAARLIVEIWNSEIRNELEAGHLKRSTKLASGIPRLELSFVDELGVLGFRAELRMNMDDGRLWGFDRSLKWPSGYVRDLGRIDYRKTFPNADSWELDVFGDFIKRAIDMGAYLENLKSSLMAVESYYKWRERDCEEV